MNNYLDHPGEEVLERFILHRSGEEELEVVETHILACESCVTRLEGLEIEIAATKLALREMKMREAAQSQVAAAQKVSWRSWFTLPRLSMAGGLAAIALVVMIAPQLRNGNAAMAQVTLSAYRGQETTVAPKAKPLHVVLNAADLTEGNLVVELVDAVGKREWKGTTTVRQDRAVVDLPKIAEPGNYYFRLYATQPPGQGELLREFSFQVK
jgi:hypothetical protein